jgi:phosphoglycerate kinase
MTIHIADYDPQWPHLFAREAARIRATLGGQVLQLEHVGSTSVLALPAKAVIDILLVVAASADEPAYGPALESAGYRLQIREPEWHQHRLFKGPDTDINLHVFSQGCPEILRMLSFRDWLRNHPADRDLYTRTKQSLAQHEWQCTQNYADAKTAVVEEILRRVLTSCVIHLRPDMSYLSIRDLDLNGKRVFIRVDFNVPLQKNDRGDMEITSDKRIKASLPTIQYALEHGAGVILASHLGRPKGKPNPEMSLKPAAKRLGELLGRAVKMAPDCIGPQVEAMLPAPGEVLLLENLRFHPEEEKNDPEFARKLAALCDVYVNDAFGSAHRAHASTEGMIAFVPQGQAAAGLLMEQELKYLGMATRNPERPCVAILGGAKVSDKIEVIENLGKVVDRLLIGGAMAYTFLKAQGLPIGKSLVEDDKTDLARKLLGELGEKLVLPVDHVVVSEIAAGAANQVVEQIPEGKIGVDIGPGTIERYTREISGAKTVIWNGPMGIFEKPPFDKGTVALAKAVAESGAVSIVGGGDSEKAIKAAGVTGKITHVSTGGGASLEFLAGIQLPGVAALEKH